MHEIEKTAATVLKDVSLFQFWHDAPTEEAPKMQKIKGLAVAVKSKKRKKS